MSKEASLYCSCCGELRDNTTLLCDLCTAEKKLQRLRAENERACGCIKCICEDEKQCQGCGSNECEYHNKLRRGLEDEVERLKDDILVLQTRIRVDGDLFDYLELEIKARRWAVKAIAEDMKDDKNRAAFGVGLTHEPGEEGAVLNAMSSRHLPGREGL